MKNTDLQVYNETPSSNWLQGVIAEDMIGSGLDSSSSPMGGSTVEEAVFACGQPLMERRLRPQHEQALKCPRCESTHTKFCYYNNYSLSQPRYFCKTCRRYWTKGGTLRNIPVGGGCRKNTRKSSSSAGVAAVSKKPLNEFHNATPSSSVSILNPESSSLSAFPLSIFTSDQTNPGDLHLNFNDQIQFNPRLFTPAGYLLENPNQIYAEQGLGFDLMETKNDTFMAAAGADFSTSGIMAAGNKFPSSSFHDIYGACLSLDHPTAGVLDGCQRLMLPYGGDGVADVKPGVKLFAGNPSTGNNSFGGYNLGGFGPWSGFMDGSSAAHSLG